MFWANVMELAILTVILIRCSSALPSGEEVVPCAPHISYHDVSGCGGLTRTGRIDARH